MELEVPDFIPHMNIEFFYDVHSVSTLAENTENSLTVLKPSA
jgi:hypothetical protein